MRHKHMVINIACDRSTSKRSVCLAEQYNNLSLEGAREKYAADIHGLLMSIFSIDHLYQASTRAGSLVSRPYPRGWSLAHGIIA